MLYKNIKIYFMTGTGNSYRVSKFIEEIAKNDGSNTILLSTKDARQNEKLLNIKNDLIGIVFPNHGFTMPWEILKFLWKLPHTKSAHAFSIATRGSLKFGKIFIPGMSGSATFIVALILRFKGYNVRGVMSVNMPSNWSTFHPIQSREKHSAIIERAEKRVTLFMDRILSGKKVWLTLNNLYEIISGLLLSLISIGYLLIGRFFHSKLFFANSNCNGCGICEKNCPYNAIKLIGKKDIPYWTYHCESCMKCTALCPKNAIEIGQSWGVILYFIAVFPISVYVLSSLNKYFPGAADFRGSWVSDIIDLLYWYPAIFISYFIFYLLLRIPFVNWIFTHTTMTHFKFWGRYKEPNTNLKIVD